MVLKDNLDTFDLPTTGGSVLLQGSIPPDDAFVVRQLRAAGAVILAKVNLSEFAAGAAMSSIQGQTRNPHDLTRTSSGSSGGTGVAVAAGYAPIGVGTDTGGSIRGPAAANGVAALKPTRGLLSRDGIIPLSPSLDTAGPMARHVYDLAAALGVMTGVDPADQGTHTGPRTQFRACRPLLFKRSGARCIDARPEEAICTSWTKIFATCSRHHSYIIFWRRDLENRRHGRKRNYGTNSPTTAPVHHGS